MAFFNLMILSPEHYIHLFLSFCAIPYGIGGAGKMPSFSVKWNAQGAIFNKPTIFNTRLGLQGVGDGGEAEAVAPISKLTAYIKEAVRNENAGLGDIIKQQFGLLIASLERIIPKGVYLDGNALVGELTPAIDAGLSTRWQHTQRGNVR